MPLINFPNLPDLPGVPQIPRLPNINLPAIVGLGLGFAQDQVLSLFASDSKWGIYDKSGKALGDPKAMGSTSLLGNVLNAAGIKGPLVDKALSYVGADGAKFSFDTFDFRSESQVSEFPVEAGGFASYNKVQKPSEPVVTFSFEGSVKERKDFLAAIDKASKSTDLYSVVTPEATYINHNITGYGYPRESNHGANLIIVRLTLREIRQVASQYTQAAASPIVAPKAPSAASLLDAGKIQAAIPGVSTLKSLADKVTSTVRGLLP